jgi:hypothetical protein
MFIGMRMHKDLHGTIFCVGGDPLVTRVIVFFYRSSGGIAYR